MYVDIESKNVVSDAGKILVYTVSNFIQSICESDNCFVCGAGRSEKEFNDEHIIPRWVLKRFSLFDEKITLPNGVPFQYGKYVIKCCSECNTFLGNNVESVIATGLNGKYEESLVFFNENRELVFVWLCLLVTKTHLKDKFFKYDMRKPNKIGEMYNWESLHHIHCVARSVFTGCRINQSVIGTMLLFPCHQYENLESFDYMDRFDAGVVSVRLGGYFILAVLNDRGIVKELLKSRLDRITGPLQVIQARELFARACEANLRINDRPRYYTFKSRGESFLQIDTIRQSRISVSAFREDVLGAFMYGLIDKLLVSSDNPVFGEETRLQREAVKNGQWTYLFDEEGRFLNGQLQFVK